MGYVTSKVKVWKNPLGVYLWSCPSGNCQGTIRAGASMYWKVAQRDADEHAREWHRPPRRLGRDTPTPPGGSHYDWSDTGMHVRIRDDSPRCGE